MKVKLSRDFVVPGNGNLNQTERREIEFESPDIHPGNSPRSDILATATSFLFYDNHSRLVIGQKPEDIYKHF